MNTQQQIPESIVVPIDLANAVATYLSRQPFADVAHLINALQQCAQGGAPVIDPGPGPKPPKNQFENAGGTDAK